MRSIYKPLGWKYELGDVVKKKSGSSWTGKVVGFYSTDLTPEGYAVESMHETGSVQIYPVKALVPLEYQEVDVVMLQMGKNHKRAVLSSVKGSDNLYHVPLYRDGGVLVGELESMGIVYSGTLTELGLSVLHKLGGN